MINTTQVLEPKQKLYMYNAIRLTDTMNTTQVGAEARAMYNLTRLTDTNTSWCRNKSYNARLLIDKNTTQAGTKTKATKQLLIDKNTTQAGTKTKATKQDS